MRSCSSHRDFSETERLVENKHSVFLENGCGVFPLKIVELILDS